MLNSTQEAKYHLYLDYPSIVTAMASKKDMRREDLSKSKCFSSHSVVNSTIVIPYKEPPAEKPDDIANTMATTLPMVAVSLA